MDFAFSYIRVFISLDQKINLEKSENDYIIIVSPFSTNLLGMTAKSCYALNAHRAFKNDLAILLAPLQCKPLFL